jgi:asparagine synthase (glutamine-hydrolysing)
MCGLAGFVDGDMRVPEPVPALAAMVATLVHRGPDGEGLWHGGQVHLGHRRLAIIDTTDAGAQPMTGQSGSVIVFNGEIYNHPELRIELESAGFHFRTRSDTEVLLAAWTHWGPDCLSRLIGMFAFALWDARAGRLFLARDRLGKKPLHFCHAGRFLAFGSEAKALLALETVRRGAALDAQALADFLTLGYVLSPKTIHANIRRLPSAHWAEFDPATGILRTHEYWRLEDHVLAPRRRYDKAAREQFAALLEDAVRIRLRADVPVGCFLSGGLDSSTVAAMAQRVASQPPRAFCVGFSDKSFDERGHARHVADHLGIALEVLEGGSEAVDLAALIHHCDDPFADTSLLPTWQLNAAAARHVKVALSGDGADEILAGYPTYRADRLYRLYRHLPSSAQAALDAGARRWLRPSYRKVSLDYKLRQFLAGRGLSPERAHAWWRVLFSADERRRMLADDLLATLGDYEPLDAFDSHFARVEKADFLDRSLYVDIKTWLVDDILVKADRMSMAHGLEVRSPFLDHRLVEFTLALEPKAKMAGRRQKVALRDAAQSLLPAAILRRRKEGFGAPTQNCGALVPPALDFPRLFRHDFALDREREDVTYKSFALGILTGWLSLHRDFRDEEPH